VRSYFRLLIPAFLALVACPLVATAQQAETGSEGDVVLEDNGSDAAPMGLSDLRFINPRARIALPEPMPGPVLRFVVADDFPPFAFLDGTGRLAGVHIDLIRAICDTLDLPCTLQARRFDQVVAAVQDDPNNLVLAAGLAVTRDTAERFTFSLPYYRFAARFIGARADAENPDWVDGARIGVVENTAHAAFLRDAYADAEIVTFSAGEDMFRALRNEDISHAFGDGIDLAFWLASDRSGDCCAYVGPPIFSVTYFGEGLAFAVPRGQSQLVQALNAALIRLESSGDLETIMLTAFPLDPLGL
jgi:polar amino acid transport system substrate-binding protein